VVKQRGKKEKSFTDEIFILREGEKDFVFHNREH
jgi:hypothetical protein